MKNNEYIKPLSEANNLPNRLVYKGLICPYCGNKTEFIDSSFVYKRSYGMIYICKPCDAYVHVHKGTSKALGRLANRELREAKKEAHFHFDKIARTAQINFIWDEDVAKMNSRQKAYKWLAMQLQIPEPHCHIGMFDVDACKKVVEICLRYLKAQTDLPEGDWPEPELPY